MLHRYVQQRMDYDSTQQSHCDDFTRISVTDVAVAHYHILYDQVPPLPYEKLRRHHLPVHTFVDNVTANTASFRWCISCRNGSTNSLQYSGFGSSTLLRYMRSSTNDRDRSITM